MASGQSGTRAEKGTTAATENQPRHNGPSSAGATAGQDPDESELSLADVRKLWSERESRLKSARIWFRVATCRSDDPSFSLAAEVPPIDRSPVDTSDSPGSGAIFYSDISRISVDGDAISYSHAPLATGMRREDGSLGIASWNGREFIAIDPDLVPQRARIMVAPSPAAFSDFGIWPLLHAIRPINSPCPLPFDFETAKVAPGRYLVNGMECRLLELPTDRTTLQKVWVSCSPDTRIQQVEFWTRSRSGTYGTSPGMRISVVDWHPLTDAGTAIPRRWHIEQLANGKVLYRFVGMSYRLELNEPIDASEFNLLPLPAGALVADFRNRDSRGPERYVLTSDGSRQPLIVDSSSILQTHPDDVEHPPAQPLPDARPVIIAMVIFLIGLQVFGWFKFRGTN